MRFEPKFSGIKLVQRSALRNMKTLLCATVLYVIFWCSRGLKNVKMLFKVKTNARPDIDYINFSKCFSWFFRWTEFSNTLRRSFLNSHLYKLWSPYLHLYWQGNFLGILRLQVIESSFTIVEHLYDDLPQSFRIYLHKKIEM